RPDPGRDGAGAAGGAARRAAAAPGARRAAQPAVRGRRRHQVGRLRDLARRAGPVARGGGGDRGRRARRGAGPGGDPGQRRAGLLGRHGGRAQSAAGTAAAAAGTGSPDVLKTLLRFFRDRLLDRLLASSPMFSSFSPEEARGLADKFLFLELDPGMRVINEGERAPGLFLLLCGDARVLRGQRERARLSPGDLFGEMSLLTRGPASATIVAETKCWTLELPRERFQEIMLTYPQMLEYVSDLADKRKQQNLAGPESRVDFL